MTPSKLVAELRQAQLDRRAAQEEVQDAKMELAERRAALNKAHQKVKDIIDEMTTGKSRTPLLDTIPAQPEKEHASP